MVNVDKLNRTIEELDIQAKEIKGIVEKEKELEILINKIEVMSSGIDSSSSELNTIKDTFSSYIQSSKEIRNGMIDKFDSLKELTLKINNKINDELMDEVINSKDVITKNIKGLGKSIEGNSYENKEILQKEIQNNRSELDKGIVASKKELLDIIKSQSADMQSIKIEIMKGIKQLKIIGIMIIILSLVAIISNFIG